jgi:hypothetical protein
MQRKVRGSPAVLRYWIWTPAGMVRQVPGPTAFSSPSASFSSLSQIRPRPSMKYQISWMPTRRTATETALGGRVQWTTLASFAEKTHRISAMSVAISSGSLDNCFIFQLCSAVPTPSFSLSGYALYRYILTLAGADETRMNLRSCLGQVVKNFRQRLFHELR